MNWHLEMVPTLDGPMDWLEPMAKLEMERAGLTTLRQTLSRVADGSLSSVRGVGEGTRRLIYHKLALAVIDALAMEYVGADDFTPAESAWVSAFRRTEVDA